MPWNEPFPGRRSTTSPTSEGNRAGCFTSTSSSTCHRTSYTVAERAFDPVAPPQASKFSP